MNIPRLRHRLKALEATARSRTNDADDVAERQALLALLCDDDRAGLLYHAYLDAVSLSVCPHQEFGACVSCWTHNQHSTVVTEAHARLQQRLIELAASPTHPNKENTP
jgi:hypothetical protein